MRRINRMLPFLRNERGVALPLALMAFVVLGALSAALLAIGSSEVQIASNHLHGTQAFYVAEAGAERALAQFVATPSLVTNATPASCPAPAAPSVVMTTGTATVTYACTVGPSTILITSVGESAGAQRVVRMVPTTTFLSDDAIRTQGPLSISGNSTVGGQCGSFHTNDDLALSGNPSISGAVTASGTYTVTGNPSVGPGSGGGQSQQTIPVINPTDFLNAAKASLSANQVFQMKANGQVLDGAGALIIALPSGDSYNGWRYTSGTPAQWQLSGNTGYNGTYYLEGNVTVSGNPGSPSTPWVTTLIATGDLIISGNPEIQTSLTDTLFIAGLDIDISSNPTQGFNGLIAAHEQFSLSGNPTINGFLIGEDASAISSTVTSNTVNGNPTITYSCGLYPPLQGPLQILSWGL